MDVGVEQQQLFEAETKTVVKLSPLVVHCKKEPYDVYIGRGSKWGNPFSHNPRSQAKYIVATREDAIQKYREWIMTQPELLASLHELKGKVLGCWCRPKSCHGDVLVELVELFCSSSTTNGEDEKTGGGGNHVDT